MAFIENLEAVRTGYEPIDHDHDEFVQLLTLLSCADKADFADLFKQMHRHVEQHFDLENRLMEQYAFPAIAEHRGEHVRVLGEFRQFDKRVEKGLIEFGRAFVNERLPQWFELHATTMDRALALHIMAQNRTL